MLDILEVRCFHRCNVELTTSFLQPFNFIAKDWHLELENIGTENIQVTVTRSIVNFVQETEQEVRLNQVV